MSQHAQSHLPPLPATGTTFLRMAPYLLLVSLAFSSGCITHPFGLRDPVPPTCKPGQCLDVPVNIACHPRPFYGFQPTCWHRWPSDWIGCPPCGEEMIGEVPGMVMPDQFGEPVPMDAPPMPVQPMPTMPPDSLPPTPEQPVPSLDAQPPLQPMPSEAPGGLDVPAEPAEIPLQPAPPLEPQGSGFGRAVPDEQPSLGNVPRLDQSTRHQPPFLPMPVIADRQDQPAQARPMGDASPKGEAPSKGLASESSVSSLIPRLSYDPPAARSASIPTLPAITRPSAAPERRSSSIPLDSERSSAQPDHSFATISQLRPHSTPPRGVDPLADRSTTSIPSLPANPSSLAERRALSSPADDWSTQPDHSISSSSSIASPSTRSSLTAPLRVDPLPARSAWIPALPVSTHGSRSLASRTVPVPMDDAIAVHLSDRSAAAKQREQTSAYDGSPKPSVIAKQRDETSRPGDSFLPPVTIENRFLTDPIGHKESTGDTNRPEDKEPEMIINPWFHPPIE